MCAWHKLFSGFDIVLYIVRLVTDFPAYHVGCMVLPVVSAVVTFSYFPGTPCAHPTTIMLSQFYDNDKRAVVGVPQVSPTLPTAEGVFVRAGVTPHFDLWIKADSPTGVAVAQAIDSEDLTAGEGEVDTMSLLKQEKASHDPQTMEEDAKFALKLQRQLDE